MELKIKIDAKKIIKYSYIFIILIIIASLIYFYYFVNQNVAKVINIDPNELKQVDTLNYINLSKFNEITEKMEKKSEIKNIKYINNVFD